MKSKEFFKEMEDLLNLKMIVCNFDEMAQVSPFMKLAVTIFHRNQFIKDELGKSCKQMFEYMQTEAFERLSTQEKVSLTGLQTRFSTHLELAAGIEAQMVQNLFAKPALKNQEEKDLAAKGSVQ